MVMANQKSDKRQGQTLPVRASSGTDKKATNKGKGRRGNTTTAPDTMNVQNVTNNKNTDMDAFGKARTTNTISTSKKGRYNFAGEDKGRNDYVPSVPKAVGVPSASFRVAEAPHAARSGMDRDDATFASHNGVGGDVAGVLQGALWRHDTTLISEITSQGTNKWNTVRKHFEEDVDKTKREVDRYTKNGLFKKLKFVTERAQMEYDTNTNSICQIVCGKVNVSRDDSFKFWKMYGRSVESILNKKRADVNSSIKRSFIGECIFHTIVFVVMNETVLTQSRARIILLHFLALLRHLPLSDGDEETFPHKTVQKFGDAWRAHMAGLLRFY